MKIVIARSVSETNATKQSNNATYESNANRLLWVNLNANNLLIQFCIIAIYNLLDSRGLDCFDSQSESRNDCVGGDSLLIRGLLRRIYDSPRNDGFFYTLIRATNHNRSNGGSALRCFGAK